MNDRAARYRHLAMAEADDVTARLLRLLADAAERGVLCAPASPKRRPVIEKSDDFTKLR